MTEDRGAGWIAFAGIMLAIIGILNVIYGIAAIGDSSFFVHNTKYIVSNLNTWGWVTLIIGVIQVLAAFSIWSGGEFGRWIGIFIAGVSMIATQPVALVANKDFPANSLAEVVALAKQAAERVNYTSPGPRGVGHLAGELLQQKADIRMTHINYNGSAPALTDVIAGRVSMMFVDVPTGLPHVNGKALKALAVTTKQRSALLPQLPTMDDTVKGFDITSWQGYLGPADMPRDIVVKLNAEIRKIVERPDIKSQLAERGMEAFSGTPEEFDAFLKAQLVLWEKLIADAGIEKQ